MATQDDIRRLALALPEAIEADHHGIPSFRVNGKIFCTIHQDQPRLMVKLAPEDQRNLAEGEPEIIQPVPGYWGRKGSTFVYYAQVDPERLSGLLRLAWSGVAPKRLSKAQGDA